MEQRPDGFHTRPVGRPGTDGGWVDGRGVQINGGPINM